MNERSKTTLARIAFLCAAAAALAFFPPRLANLSRLRAEAREFERRIASLRLPAKAPSGGGRTDTSPDGGLEAPPGSDLGAMPETVRAAGPYDAASLLKHRLAGLGFDDEPSIRVESSGGISVESSAPDAEPLSSALREIAVGAFPAAVTGLSFRLEREGALTLTLEAIHAR